MEGGKGFKLGVQDLASRRGQRQRGVNGDHIQGNTKKTPRGYMRGEPNVRERLKVLPAVTLKEEAIGEEFNSLCLLSLLDIHRYKVRPR